MSERIIANDQLPAVKFEQDMDRLRAGLVADGLHPKAADYIVAEIRDHVLPIISRPPLTLQIPEELIPAVLQIQEYLWSGQGALIQEIAILVGTQYIREFGNRPPPSSPEKPPRPDWLRALDGGKSKT